MSKTTPVKRAKRRTGAADTMNPDDIKLHRVIVVGVALTLAAAVGVSLNGLLFVGEWQLLPETVRWLTPVMVDVPLVVLTLARGALKKRGVGTPWMLAGIVGLTLVSSAANLLHTIDAVGFDTLPAYVGSGMNALAPFLILGMTEVLWLVITKPASKRAPAATRAKAPARAKAQQRRTAAAPVLADEPSTYLGVA